MTTESVKAPSDQRRKFTWRSQDIVIVRDTRMANAPGEGVPCGDAFIAADKNTIKNARKKKSKKADA